MGICSALKMTTTLLGRFTTGSGHSQILRDSKQRKGTPSEKGVPFKWSKPKPVCGISVVKRKIAAVFTAAISIFGGLEGDRTLDLCDANAALSRVRHNTGPVLLAGRGFLVALFGPVYCAGFIGNANHWEEVSE